MTTTMPNDTALTPETLESLANLIDERPNVVTEVLHGMRKGMYSCAAAWAADRAAMVQQGAKAEALERVARYAQHKDCMRMWHVDGVDGCACGLDDALAALAASGKEKP